MVCSLCAWDGYNSFYIYIYNIMRLFPILFPFHKWENWGSRKMPNKSNLKKSKSVSHSFVSDTLQPYGLQPTRLLCPWDSPGKNTEMGSHSLLQGIFMTQGSNLGLLHCRHSDFFIIWATRLMTRLKLNYLFNGPVSKYSHNERVRVSMNTLWGDSSVRSTSSPLPST